MSAILALTTLCTVGIIDTATGFGILYIALILMIIFLGMQVVVFMGLLSSDQISCFTTSGSSFIFTGCQFFLNYSIFGLVGGALPLASLHLVQLIENADSFTVVSAGLTQILVFMTLCAAGIVTGFDSSAFPNMQVIALGVGLTAFCLVMPTDVLHLAWSYSRAIRDAVSRLQGLSLC
jgi:hypothetical protein